MAYYDGMREAEEAGNKSQREAERREKRKALDDVAYRGRRATDEEVVEGLADLQDHGKSLTTRDAKTLASARAVIEKLTKELQQRNRFMDHGGDLDKARYKSPCPLPTAHEQELLTILLEECSEVQKRATKALRFGLAECQPGKAYNNAQRLGLEIGDLLEMIDQLVAVGVVSPAWIREGERIQEKTTEKVHADEGPQR